MNIEQNGDEIIVKIDVSELALKDAKPSSTGKTLMVATTNGFTRMGRFSLNLNCTMPNPDYEGAKGMR
jgi:hypothetical protein